MHRNGSDCRLQDGSRVAVIGGGPAGSFFSYFLLDIADSVGTKIKLDLYEPRDFSRAGPAGCNMCGGIISESLVQSLAMEGIHLRDGVVQRTIDSYVLHMDIGGVKIETPLREKRIASVHRGGGPRGCTGIAIGGLDGQLLEIAVSKGATVIQKRVEQLSIPPNGKPKLRAQGGIEAEYDLVVGAVGVNSSALKLFEAAGISYGAPETSKTYITEFLFGRDNVRWQFGYSMHVFLLNIPRLEFAALIPKGDYVTLCMLGEDIDNELVNAFLKTPEVKEVLPPDWEPPADRCHCSPKISISSATRLFADRVVFVGDCGATRLYKDGIGAAFRTAKAAARTAIFNGVSAKDFEQNYWPVCKSINFDNAVGKLVFMVTTIIQRLRVLRRGMWLMVSKEQRGRNGNPRMSSVLWDTFTGSAPYLSVLRRTLHPAFITNFVWDIVSSGYQVRTQKSRGKDEINIFG